MAKIALQTDDAGMKENPGIIGGLNTNSPLLFEAGRKSEMINHIAVQFNELYIPNGKQHIVA